MDVSTKPRRLKKAQLVIFVGTVQGVKPNSESIWPKQTKTFAKTYRRDFIQAATRARLEESCNLRTFFGMFVPGGPGTQWGADSDI